MNDFSHKLTKVFGDADRDEAPEDAARRSTKLFVQGRTQLAVFHEGRRPKGHVISAWEAYQAYGLDILEEAVEYGTAILAIAPDAVARTVSERRRDLGLPMKTVAARLRLPVATLAQIEEGSSDPPFTLVEKVGFALGLDETQLGFRQATNPDPGITARLKTLQETPPDIGLTPLKPSTVITFSEAASIVRAQNRMRNWLGLPSMLADFEASGDYGSAAHRAWRVGYNLAIDAREALALGSSPIRSMRELVEERLGIPVVQARLPNQIAGATIAAKYHDGVHRGILLNTVGSNRNPLVRRSTLAHELGHLLYDPDQELESVRVDSYASLDSNPESSVRYVEQRANAFAVAFVAPNDEVRKLTPLPLKRDHVALIMNHFGISYTAARFHIVNAHYRTDDPPEHHAPVGPSDEWRAAEDFALDYFPIESTPSQRRGRFAGLVAECVAQGLLSYSTAADYLVCPKEELEAVLESIRSIYPIERS